MFEQNDRTLFTAQSIIKVFCIIGAILCFIGGIVLFITSNQKVTDNFGKISNVTNYAQIIGGVALILFSSLVFWIIWIFSKLIFSTLCDIKFIRNKLYQLDNDNLKSFIEEEEEESDNTTNDNKKKSFLDKFKDL